MSALALTWSSLSSDIKVWNKGWCWPWLEFTHSSDIQVEGQFFVHETLDKQSPRWLHTALDTNLIFIVRAQNNPIDFIWECDITLCIYHIIITIIHHQLETLRRLFIFIYVLYLAADDITLLNSLLLFLGRLTLNARCSNTPATRHSSCQLLSFSGRIYWSARLERIPSSIRAWRKSNSMLPLQNRVSHFTDPNTLLYTTFWWIMFPPILTDLKKIRRESIKCMNKFAWRPHWEHTSCACLHHRDRFN